MNDFLKRRWMPLVMLVVVLAAVPAMIWYSSKMKTDLRDRVSREVQQDLSSITSTGSTLRVNYKVPGVAGSSDLDYKWAPNPLAINKFKNWRDAQLTDLQKVVADALALNQGKRTVLLEGVFPEPDASDMAIKPLEFRRVYFEQAHQNLLRKVRAGGPPDPIAIAQELRDKQAEFIRTETGQESADFAQLPPDMQKKINDEMSKFRLSRYGNRAATLSFYCDMEAFKLPPLSQDAAAPTISEAWRWQWDYWIREDILTAAAAANFATADQGIPASIIKRIDSIGIDNLVLILVDPTNPAPAVYPPGSDAVVPVNPEISVTGRSSGPNSNNSFYDLRRVTVELVAQTSKLPAFIDALSATNLMTVLDCDLYRVDVDEELKVGYYYGKDPVVRAKMQIESIWLREWMLPMTPPLLRQEMMMADPPPPPGTDPDALPEQG